MTARICLVLGMGLGGAQSALAEGQRPPLTPDFSHTNQDHFGSPGGGLPREPKGPDLHTNQDGMMPPEGPPEAPPEGEESRLGDPLELPFDVPHSTHAPSSVLVVAERLGGLQKYFGPRVPHSQKPDRHPAWGSLVKVRFPVPRGSCCSWPRVVASVDVRGEPFELRPHPAGLAKPALAGMIAFPQFRLQPLGAIAQLGERLHGMQEVVGSSPISSTLKARRPWAACFVFTFLLENSAFIRCWVRQSSFLQRPLIFLTFSAMGSRGSRLL